MKTNLLKTTFASFLLTFVALAGVESLRAQDVNHKANRGESSQAPAASKTAKFETVAKSDALYASAIDAHDKAAAEKMNGKSGAFRGTVAKLFSPRSGTIVILNFDDDYKSALTAVLKKDNFSKFPDLAQLEGKEIIVSGKFTEFKGSPQIELKDAKQIAVVR